MLRQPVQCSLPGSCSLLLTGLFGFQLIYSSTLITLKMDRCRNQLSKSHLACFHHTNLSTGVYSTTFNYFYIPITAATNIDLSKSEVPKSSPRELPSCNF
ncbi:hypothetical protein XENOCAPTIV_008563 [Xenoophorus captivus]|uniref:Uncharacterized protein n=1 Tax=Xenoophorus captivus TaxID=1517983 RepID=A0ABV0RKD5_9TELE